MILATTNQKGGTGKSLIATNVAACFARDGFDVLLIDADPQHTALDWKADRPEALPPVEGGVDSDSGLRPVDARLSEYPARARPARTFHDPDRRGALGGG